MRGTRGKRLTDQLPDPPHALGGCLRAVAEFLGHQADAAADAEPPHGAADHFGQGVRGQDVRSLQP